MYRVKERTSSKTLIQRISVKKNYSFNINFNSQMLFLVSNNKKNLKLQYTAVKLFERRKYLLNIYKTLVIKTIYFCRI